MKTPENTEKDAGDTEHQQPKEISKLNSPLISCTA